HSTRFACSWQAIRRASLAHGRPFDLRQTQAVAMAQRSAANALSKPEARRRVRSICKDNPLANPLVSQHPEGDLLQFPTRETPPPASGSAFVYILACADGGIYVGSACDVAKRLSEHCGSKGAKFTRDHPGVRLIYVEGPLPNTIALQRERQLKRW